ncbi:guanine deaminase [Rhodobacteraceae bacterium]|nr:guanine deaminase [Paracoccaceae bacterium]
MCDLLLGQVICFNDTAMTTAPLDNAAFAMVHHTQGGVVVDQGKIQAVGPAVDLRKAYPDARIHDYGTKLISAGFIDAHVHFAQTAIVASWGKRLIDWLNTYTFPEEMRFDNIDYARAVARTYFDLALSNGTTTMCSFATIHPQSVDAFFTEARSRGMRALAGKTCMDRNAPDGLRDTAQSAYDDSLALLNRWHGQDRLSYVITPRFSPTSTEGQLRALGSLWAEHPDCLMQTHLSEQTDEVEWVKSLFPQARDYLDTYEAFGLLGANGIYGHAIHLEPREVDRLREHNSAIAHCPTSNTFIGSGIFPMTDLADTLRVGLATDTGGGSSFSMLRTMAAAYELGQLRGTPLTPPALWWLATQGAARSLHLEDRIGNIAPGMEADLIVIDLESTPAIKQRMTRAETFQEALFATIMMGDDRAIDQVWINGKKHD